MAGGERVTIPLFPLGMVLFPGLLLPLNIFEERYRQLVRDLLALPEGTPPRFGVLGIRHGREVGADSIEALYEVGTVASVSQVAEQDDGRYELVSVGTERFRLLALDHSAPYLQGEVQLLDDPLSDGDDGMAAERVPALLAAYRTYLDVLGETRGTTIDLPDLPNDPPLLSWLVAATVLVDLPVRQQLLEVPDVAARLASEVRLLRQETALLRTVAAAPAPDLTRLPQSPN
jgi:Lon protease-like protein